ncbi:Protein FAM163B [Oryzias melastigma]|uniref:Family with sequence similarity 163 member B n=1 Tax=Oryzias melastigma TaxID=30732 RepID=A0A3B3BC71_ORYME|nr:protein FAM163B [Oryzias melastigma]XP_036069653.1 protein FAM163B [Oryzias melastigma]KAF6716984.1 Protein FAM163B [Oryzias melastigma]
MSAGTVVIAGGILAAVILLTIVAVLCLCRLQYYCCKREESEKGEEDEPELTTMSPSRPLALCAPPTPPTPEHHSDEPETYPPTFLTEANGPASYSPPPPPRRCQRAQAFCPSCARCTLPFYLQHPERLCNGGHRISYRTVQQQDLELPADLANFYQNLLRSYTRKEVVTHSISTDV